MIVLHYIPSIDRSSGGVGSYIQLLADSLGKLVDLHVVTHHSDNELVIRNCKLHFIGKALKVGKELELLLKDIKPDVVQTNTCWLPLSSIIVKKAKRLGIPVVYCPHGMLEPWIMRRHYLTKKLPALLLYQREALRKADVLLATAESERQNLLKLGYNKNIEVVPNCIDINSITMKAEWKRTNKILFFSRIHEKKGIEFLIEAVARLKDRLNGYSVVIAGEGDHSYINKLKTLAKKLDVDGMIEFVGGIYNEDKWALYHNADVMVLPTYSENFGIVVTEALACGTPVITTKGTPWEELATRHCGWWTEIGTDATAEAIEAFLSCSEDELERMGRNGRALIEEKYSSEKVAEKMRTFYQNVINNK